MIAYLDASAMVKLYVSEPHSEEVRRLVDEAQGVGTVTITRTEVSAALAKAARLGALPREDAAAADSRFRSDWPDFLRLPVTEPLLEKAAGLAWDQGLRGYDAVQLAAALSWQEAVEAPITLATFDRGLWAAAAKVGLDIYPGELAALTPASPRSS
jgi:uncharacterized protein